MIENTVENMVAEILSVMNVVLLVVVIVMVERKLVVWVADEVVIVIVIVIVIGVAAVETTFEILHVVMGPGLEGVKVKVKEPLV